MEVNEASKIIVKAASTGNMKDLRNLTSTMESLTLEKVLSETFEQINAHNIRVAKEVELFLQQQLIQLRFYCKAKNVKFNIFEDVKKRTIATIDLIKSLSELKIVNDEYLCLGRLVAQNLEVLKNVLKKTYNKLPWEEMQHCLITYISIFKSTNNKNLMYKLILDVNRLSAHLKLFNQQLEKISSALTPKDLGKIKLANRSQLIRAVLEENPKFEDLYNDFFLVKSLYSLDKIETNLKLAENVDTNDQLGMIVIERVLQVFGEHLNNTPLSPNISEAIRREITSRCPVGLQSVMYELRNSLTHEKLTRKLKLESDCEFYGQIQEDLKKIVPEIVQIIQDTQMLCLKAFFSRVKEANKLSDLQDYYLTFMELDSADSYFIKSDNYTCRHLFAMLQEFKDSIHDLSCEEEKFFGDIFAILDGINAEKEANVKKYNDVLKTAIEMSMITPYANMPNYIKGIAEEGLNMMIESPKEKEALEKIQNMIKEIRKERWEFIREKSRIQRAIDYEFSRIQNICDLNDELIKEDEENKEQSELDLIFEELKNALNDNDVTELQTKLEAKKNLHFGKMKLISAVKEKSKGDLSFELEFITKKDAKKIELLYNEEKYEECLEFVQKIDDSYGLILKYFNENDNKKAKKLKSVLTTFVSSLKLKKAINEKILILIESIIDTQIIDSYKSRLNVLQTLVSDFEANELYGSEMMITAIEMLLLDLLEILESRDYFSEGHVIDDASPILLGKSLRNYLAHGNPLYHILPFDPNVTVVCNAIKIAQDSPEILKSKETRIGPSMKSFEAHHGRNIAFVKHLEAKIESARRDNLDNSEDVWLMSRDYKNRTLLHFAAETDNLDTFKSLLDNIAWDIPDINRETCVQVAVKHNSHKILKHLIDNLNLDPNYSDQDGKKLIHWSSKFGSKDCVKILIDHNAIVNTTNKFDATPLHHAARFNDPELIQILIDNGCEVNTNNGLTPLQMACFFGNERVVKVLISNGAEVETQKWRPLILSLYNKNEAIALDLIRSGAAVNVPDENGILPLHLAVAFGKTTILEELLKSVDDVNATTVDGETALCIAAGEGQVDAVKRLLRAGAELESIDKKGFTALCNASGNGHLECVKILEKAGADVNFRTAYLETPLHLATIKGHKNVIELLLELGADLEARNGSGVTPLFSAVINNHYELVELFLKKGADLNAEDQNKWTPLLNAAYSDKFRIVQLLLGSEKINPSSCNAQGWTALHLSALNGNYEIIRLLLEYIELNCTDYEGNTPLHFAARYGKKEVVTILIGAGANVEVKNKSERTALDYAAEGGHEDVVKILVANVENHESAALLAAKAGLKNVLEILMEKIDVNKPVKRMTYLQMAAINGHKNVAEMLLNNRADINRITDDLKLTPLQIAIAKGYLDLVEFLVNRNSRLTDEIGQSLLLWTCANCKGNLKEVLKILINVGLDVNTKNNENLTCLHAAVCNSDADTVRFLLDKGAKALEDKNGQPSPLYLAIAKCDEEMIFLLLERSIGDLEGRVENEATPLLMAVGKGQLEVVKKLVDLGADVSVVSGKGTVLHAGVTSGDASVLRFVLEEVRRKLGSDGFLEFVDVKDADGNKADEISGNTMVKELLKEYLEIIR